MPAYFADSSALGKLYIQETGSAWMQSLVPTAERFYVGRIAVVEIASILARRVRDGQISPTQQQTATAIFHANLAQLLDVIELSPTVADLAAEVALRQNLRALDAIQLASALSIHVRRQQVGLSPLIFLSADIRLNAAAVAEGLAVDDPNQHP